MMRKGNKQNSLLNGEWASHVKKKVKKLTSRLRRLNDQKIIRDELKWELLSPEESEKLPS